MTKDYSEKGKITFLETPDEKQIREKFISIQNELKKWHQELALRIGVKDGQD